MSKTGDIYGAGSKSVNVTGKVKGYIQIGLDEKAVIDYLNQQTERLTQKLKDLGQTVTNEVVKELSTLVESKFEEFIYNIHAEQADSEEIVREAVQKKFKELQNGNELFKNFPDALNEKLAEGNKLLQSISILQNKAVYYAEKHYNALDSRLDDIRERVEHINDREDRKDLENISSLQKKLEYGHSALQSAEFERAKKHFEVVTASNLGGSDLALVANAYFGMALAEWQIQLIWDDKRNSEQFILYEYDIDLSDKHGSYREAITNATSEQADVFRKFVDKLRCAKEKLCDYRDNGLSYDCFICTKVSEYKGGPSTDDCDWIKENKLYEVLTQNGSKPFYSEEDCKKYAIEKGTLEYESLIYYALSRAKVMLLVCSKQGYLETPWVANEINRFRQFRKKRGENPLKRIIVVHEDAAIELPSDLEESYQGWNRKETNVETIAAVVEAAVANASGYVESGWMYCPICGKKYSPDMEECSSNQCPAYPVRTRLVDELTRANILRNRDREEYEREIEKQKQVFEQNARREREEYEREIEKLRRENEALLKSKQDVLSTQDIALGLEGVKFGLSCGTGNPKSAKICMESGGTTFAQTRIDDVRKAEETGRVAQRLKRREDKKDRKALLLKLKKEAEIRRAEKLKGKPWLAPDYPMLKHYDKREFGIEETELKKYLKKDFSGEVKIPWGVTSIGPGAFACSGLTSIIIPDSVTSIGMGAFKGCVGLTLITIPNSVTSIGVYAFSDCSGLNSIIIPDSVTSIGDLAFNGCKGLTSITIPNSVTSIGMGAFKGCEGLTSITIPKSVTSLRLCAFDGCVGLTSITIPNSVTSIGRHAFSDCSGLNSITIPDSVTTIGDLAFNDCKGLTSITISNSVTSIGIEAFRGCSGLTSIIIPDSVTYIGSHAFLGCDLTTIYCEAKEQPKGWDKNWNPDNRPVIWGYKKQK